MNKCYSIILVLCFILFLTIPLSAQPFEQDLNRLDAFGCGFLEGGYPSNLSGYKGDTVKFYISTNALLYDLKIYRYGKTKELVATIPNVKGGIREVKESDYAYVNGCKWPESARLVIPQDWKPGAYLAEFPVTSDTTNPVLFFVKDKNTKNRVIVVCHTNTYQAYNMFGGKSVYPAYSSGGGSGISENFSERLSFFRPFNRNQHNGINRGSFYAYDAKLIRWLEEEGYDVDVMSDTDLDMDLAYLKMHKVLMLTGHSEYWSRAMRDNVVAFLDQGGHFMCLSGNTCWWQIHYENNYHTFVCYKHKSSDPFMGTPNGTQEWYTMDRENKFLGTSYQNGGQTNYWPKVPGVNTTPCMDWREGFGGYIVHNAQHWAFDNTGLTEGDTLGYNADSSVVGYESDGALFTFRNGLPKVTGSDQTPANFTILGLSPANHSSYDVPEQWATMGIFKYNKDTNPHAGYVFNAATIRWAWGLQSHKTGVSKLTKNVLDHFLRNSFPPEFTSWWPYSGKSELSLKTKMAFNYRNIEIPKGKKLFFKVNAADPNKEAVSYYWTINDTLAGTENSIRYNSLEHSFGKNIVKAYAYNSKDTSSISWEVNMIPGGRELTIANRPDSAFRIGRPFNFALRTAGKGNRIHYRVDHLPEWAEFDLTENEIKGVPTGSCAKEDSICIAAIDEMGNIDQQTYRLNNEETTKVTDKTLPEDFELLQNFPNPFNGATRIRFYVKNLSETEIIISDALGKTVRTYLMGETRPGFHEVTWDGSNDFGHSVSSGVYFYRIKCSVFDSPVFSMMKKMTYIK
ncbi:MAG: N,N-dimethylformamidase beta subunit family domain-containing protein [Ignavibacteriales bacterium]